MLSLFILLIVSLSIAIGIGFGITNLISTNQTLLLIQQNQVRMQNVSNAIRANLTVDGGNVLLPVRDGLVARIPDASPFAVTTSGREIVYCPAFEAPGTSADFVNTLADGSEEVFKVDTVALNGKTYVKRGHAAGIDVARMAELGIVGYLISPQPYNQAPIKCGAVTFSEQDTFTLLVNGGTVTPIYKVTTDARGATFILALGGSKPLDYEGNARVVNTFADIGDFIERYNLTDVTVKLQPEAVTTVSLADFETFLSKGFSRTLRIEPAEKLDSDGHLVPATSTLKLDAGAVSTDFSNVYLRARGNLLLRNLVVQGKDASGVMDVAVDAGPASTLMIQNSRLGGLRATGGTISTADGGTISPVTGIETTTLPVLAQSGEILIQSGTTIEAPDAKNVLLASGGRIVLNGTVAAYTGDISTNLHRLYFAEKGGTVTASTGNVEVHRPTGTFLETVGPVSVKQDCALGDLSCLAECTGGRVASQGSCLSSGAALSSFGTTDDGGYLCEWASASLTSAPVARATCDFR
jgi:hypothetical protein